MICKNKKCNTELVEGVKFCEKCGRKQEGALEWRKIALIGSILVFAVVMIGSMDFISGLSKDSRLLDDSLYASLDFSDMSKNEKINFFALEMVLADFETIEEIQDLAIRLFPDNEQDFNSAYLYGVNKIFGPKESFPLVNTMYDSADERATVKAMLTHNTEEASTNGAASEITIEPDFVFTFERNYDYVKGSLKNGSNKTIAYIEIVAKYKNANGEVIDSDYTNETDIAPGESRYFEIMHKTVPGTHSVSLSLSNIRFE